MCVDVTDVVFGKDAILVDKCILELLPVDAFLNDTMVFVGGIRVGIRPVLLVREDLIIWHRQRSAIKNFTQTIGATFIAIGEEALEVGIGQSVGARNAANELRWSQLKQPCSYLTIISGTSVIFCENAAQCLVDIDPVLVHGTMRKVILIHMVYELWADTIKPPFPRNNHAEFAAQRNGLIAGTPCLEDRIESLIANVLWVNHFIATPVYVPDRDSARFTSAGVRVRRLHPPSQRIFEKWEGKDKPRVIDFIAQNERLSEVESMFQCSNPCIFVLTK